jgi:hypothetical protein
MPRVHATNSARIALAAALVAVSAVVARRSVADTVPEASPTTVPAFGNRDLLATTLPTRVLDANAIRVGIYNGTGGRPLGNGEGNVARCLADGGQFDFRLITAEQIREGVLDEVDVLVQSGCGNGGGQAKALEAGGREAIRKFVAGGGGYVGICAGAYLATSEYPWSLHILNAKLVDRAHWARGKGEVTVSFNDRGQSLLNVSDGALSMRFAQGPLLMPAAKAGLPPYESLAKFDGEITDNGAPADQMRGATAAASAPFDQGRVICLSPHPEATAGYEGILRRAVSWAARRVVD